MPQSFTQRLDTFPEDLPLTDVYHCHGCGKPAVVAVPFHAGAEPRCWACLREYVYMDEIVVLAHEAACPACGAPTAPVREQAPGLEGAQPRAAEQPRGMAERLGVRA